MEYQVAYAQAHSIGGEAGIQKLKDHNLIEQANSKP